MCGRRYFDIGFGYSTGNRFPVGCNTGIIPVYALLKLWTVEADSLDLFKQRLHFTPFPLVLIIKFMDLVHYITYVHLHLHHAPLIGIADCHDHDSRALSKTCRDAGTV